MTSKKTDEVWQDFRKTQEYIKKEWVDTGFITVHQWKNFIDYLNIFIEKQFQKKIDDIKERLKQLSKLRYKHDWANFKNAGRCEELENVIKTLKDD